MKNNFLSVQRGKFLTAQTIMQVREIWRKAFPADEPIEPEKRNLFAADIFFIFRRPQKEILSVGRLRPVDIDFLGKIYKIQGIADIVSVIEKQGYGRIIMQAMYKYLVHRKQTGVGFCSPAISSFYRKCGFKIAKNLTHRFLYKNPNEKIIRDVGYDDVFYISGNDGFMKKVLENPSENIFIPYSHW